MSVGSSDALFRAASYEQAVMLNEDRIPHGIARLIEQQSTSTTAENAQCQILPTPVAHRQERGAFEPFGNKATQICPAPEEAAIRLRLKRSPASADRSKIGDWLDNDLQLKVPHSDAV